MLYWCATNINVTYFRPLDKRMAFGAAASGTSLTLLYVQQDCGMAPIENSPICSQMALRGAAHHASVSVAHPSLYYS